MKYDSKSNTSSKRSFMAKIVCFLLITAGSGMADNSVKMEVTVKNKHLEPGGNNKTEVQERWLEISATALHLEKPTSVRLEWNLYGVNLELKTKSLVKKGEGIEVVDMKQSQRTKLVTQPALFMFTRKQTVATGTGIRSKVKVIEASGLRYHGWGVRAFVGGSLVGEAYSSTEIQKLMSPP